MGAELGAASLTGLHFSYSLLFALIVAWLGVLALIAWATETERLPVWLTRHPLVYALSLGVYATSWTYYGSVGFAATHGYEFLTIYLGPTLACLLIPTVWLPLMRLSREYQLSSIADVLAFRFQSQGLGQGVTLFLLIGMVPYLGLQFRAVVKSMEVLSQGEPPVAPGLGFCLLLILFSTLLGARHASSAERHPGLAVAMAVETAVKVLILLVVGAYVIWGMFGGVTSLSQWLEAHPARAAALYAFTRDDSWNALLLLSCAASFLLPRQFHMAFTENHEEGSLKTAAWAFPGVMLLLNLAIPPILWAGQRFLPAGQPDQYVLLVTTGAGVALPLLVFVGGVASATGMLVVSPLALSHMTLNHLVLPLRFPRTPNLYRWLQRSRRVLVAFMLLAGYGFYRLVDNQMGLAELGLISFVACAQLIPGVVGTLFWARANRTGAKVGLSLGFLVWMSLLMGPLLESTPMLKGLLPDGMSLSGWLRWGMGPELWASLGIGTRTSWHGVTLWSLGLNTLGFVVGSLVTKVSPEEEESARICLRRGAIPLSPRAAVGSVSQFFGLLEPVLGADMARRELNRALDELYLRSEEKRPQELTRLRNQLERNLSGYLGPMLARMVMREDSQRSPEDQFELVRNIQFIEARLEGSRVKLSGIARDLDRMRRFHRLVLQELPMGVCTVAGDGTVLFWNQRMERLSGLSEVQVGGLSLNALPEPWGAFLAGFAGNESVHLYKQPLRMGTQTRWFNLSKARLDARSADGTPENRGQEARALETLPSAGLEAGTETVAETQGLVLLLEDLTEQRQLEHQLAHAERLASIGRLAAGVGHEIGNPLTGIACMVQNMQAEERNEDDLERFSLMLQEIMRIRDILQALARFAHPGRDDAASGTETHISEGTPELPAAQAPGIRLRAVVGEAQRLVELSRRAQRGQIQNLCREGLLIAGPHGAWVQVFVNLLTNACDASTPGERVEVDALRVGEQVMVEVRDEGHGLDPRIRDQVFEPFVTSKAPGEGTGLGLSIVYSIVQAQGGDITLEPRPEKGTVAILRLSSGVAPSVNALPPETSG